MLNREHGIIGGMFGLEMLTETVYPSEEEKPVCLMEPSISLATARSVFALLTRTLCPKTVWLPSYLCGVIMPAFSIVGVQVRFYSVGHNLKIFDDRWLGEIRLGDIAIFIDYFGFSEWAEFGLEAKRKGAWIVEDACQAMLNKSFCDYSDYLVFSPRKFVGVPDGGILLCRSGAKVPELADVSVARDWWLKAAKASLLRAEFDRHGGDRGWFPLFQETEATGPLAPCRMSDLTSVIMTNVVHWRVVAERRRRNYEFLASHFEEAAIFPTLPGEVVPLGFPIRLQNRDRVLKDLFRANIYPPVHWPVADVVPPNFEESHRLANEIMTLPCDQRYDISDLERMKDEFYAATKSVSVAPS